MTDFNTPAPAATADDELLRRARKRVDRKMGFYVHALVFVLVNLGLFAASQLFGHGRWGIWPMWGWGLGLAIHGIVTFLSLRGEGLRDRMLADEVARLRQRP
jgi:2TM domain